VAMAWCIMNRLEVMYSWSGWCAIIIPNRHCSCRTMVSDVIHSGRVDERWCNVFTR
jgi:hypothetical protein